MSGPDKPAVDEEMVRSLARLLDETRLTEIEIEQGGLRVRVARQAAAPAPFAIAAAESQRPVAAVINAHRRGRPRRASRPRDLADGRHRLSRA